MSEEQTTVTTPDIVCGGCVNAIRNAFGRVDGVTKVEVDLETKQMRVDHSRSVSREDIVRILDGAGFASS